MIYFRSVVAGMDKELGMKTPMHYHYKTANVFFLTLSVCRFLPPSPPFFATERGVGVPPGVSKLIVVELSGRRTSGLLSTSTRDWWCVFGSQA